MDFVLVAAATRANSERCQTCGGPKYLCANPDTDIDIETDEHICYVAKAREAREKKAQGKDGKGDMSGKSFSAEPFSRTGRPLGSFREPYWEDVAKKRKAVLKARPGYKPEPELNSE